MKWAAHGQSECMNVFAIAWIDGSVSFNFAWEMRLVVSWCADRSPPFPKLTLPLQSLQEALSKGTEKTEFEPEYVEVEKVRLGGADARVDRLWMLCTSIMLPFPCKLESHVSSVPMLSRTSLSALSRQSRSISIRTPVRARCGRRRGLCALTLTISCPRQVAAGRGSQPRATQGR